MAKKKKPDEKLPPIPRSTKPPDEDAGGADSAAPPAAPDLSKIAEGLRPLAVPIGELQFDPANAVTHSEGNLEGIKGSLHVYGQRKPVVVNRRTGAVEAGNGTLAAALSLGWTHLAAVYVDDDPATAAGYSIADNRTSDLHTWDKAALDKLLREVSTGNDARLDAMLADLAKEQKLVPGDDAEGDDQEGGDQSDELTETFQVLVILKTVEEQTALLERLAGEGFECRSLIS